MATTKLRASLFVWCLLFISLFSKTLQGTPMYPKPESTYLNDFARIINENDSIEIKNALFNFQKDFHFPVVLVTIDDLGGEEVHIYATKLANQWGIGDKEQNKGTLLLFSREDRKITLQLGRGNRDSISTSDREQIIKNMIAHFKKGDYSSGLKVGTRQTLTLLKKWVEKGQPSQKASSKGVGPGNQDPSGNSFFRTLNDIFSTLFFAVSYICMFGIVGLICAYFFLGDPPPSDQRKYFGTGRLDPRRGGVKQDYPYSSDGDFINYFQSDKYIKSSSTPKVGGPPPPDKSHVNVKQVFPHSPDEDFINYFQSSLEASNQSWPSSGSPGGNSSWNTSSSSSYSSSSGSHSGGSNSGGGGSFDGDGSSGSW